MSVKKFIAASSREALRKVRDALGPDAVILSNRGVQGAVEILALTQDAISSMTTPAAEQAEAVNKSAPRLDRPVAAFVPKPVSLPSSAARPLAASIRAVIPAVQPADAPVAAVPVAQGTAAHVVSQHFVKSSTISVQVPKPHVTPSRLPGLAAFATRSGDETQASDLSEKLIQARHALDQPATASPAKERASQPAASAPVSVGEDAQVIMSEIQSMRGMIEEQLTQISWGATQKREPAKAAVLRALLAAGFSAALSRYLTENMPNTTDAAEGLQWAKTILARNLATLSNEDAMIEKGGVYALVGPTGVGKTTTTAKLAARCVMRHGPGKLALITTDGYRIGGYEQLRIYGKILGVMVHSVKDESDLRIALNEMKGKHTVLIDTVGVSQRDQMVAEQVAMLSGADTHIKRLLCLNATSTGETLSEVVRAYKGTGLAGCVMTKGDEAATIGNLLDVVIREKMDLYYVANGQRVPEDLQVADKQHLLDRAFKLKRESGSFELQDSELPLVMASTAGAMRDRSLREVRLG